MGLADIESAQQASEVILAPHLCLTCINIRKGKEGVRCLNMYLPFASTASTQLHQWAAVFMCSSF